MTVDAKQRPILVLTLPAQLPAGNCTAVKNMNAMDMLIRDMDGNVLANLCQEQEAKFKLVKRWSWRKFRRVPTWVVA